MVLTYHESSLDRRSFGPVRKRPGNGEVSVEADDQQVEHGGVAGQVVEGQPRITKGGTERPVAHDGVDGEEGHGDEADGDVGDGQAEEEVIAYGLQLLVDFEGDHDHDVADDGDDAQRAGQDDDEHHLGQLEARLVAAAAARRRHHRRPARRRVYRQRRVQQVRVELPDRCPQLPFVRHLSPLPPLLLPLLLADAAAAAAACRCPPLPPALGFLLLRFLLFLLPNITFHFQSVLMLRNTQKLQNAISVDVDIGGGGGGWVSETGFYSAAGREELRPLDHTCMCRYTFKLKRVMLVCSYG